MLRTVSLVNERAITLCSNCAGKVSSCDQINIPLTEQIDRNDSKLRQLLHRPLNSGSISLILLCFQVT